MGEKSIEMAKEILSELDKKSFCIMTASNRDVAKLAGYLHLGGCKAGMESSLKKAKKILSEENIASSTYNDLIDYGAALYLK